MEKAERKMLETIEENLVALDKSIARRLRAAKTIPEATTAGIELGAIAALKRALEVVG